MNVELYQELNLTSSMEEEEWSGDAPELGGGSNSSSNSGSSDFPSGKQNQSKDSGSDINLVVMSGTIDSPPKIINTQNGTQGVALSLAVAKSIKDKMTEEMKMINSWYNLVSYNQSVVGIGSKLNKGQKVLVQGPLNVRSWQDQAGQKRIRYEISMEKLTVLDGMSDSGSDASDFALQEDSVPF